MKSSLLQNIGGYVDGRWMTSADSRATFEVRNPANGELLATVPDLAASETERAVASAARYMRTETPLQQRRSWLEKIHQTLMANKAEIARIITHEQGKPLNESQTEVEYAAGFFSFFAKQMTHLEPSLIDKPGSPLKWRVHHRPAGVAGLITPWNFPLAMLAKKLAPAIATGCGSVTKPADLTPLTAIALWHLLDDLNLPAGACNLVVGKAPPIGEVLCRHPDVRLISFTGSTAVGKQLLQQTAPYIKRLALELGGNAPFIVCDDAAIDNAIDALMQNKFRCAGQTCVCANRILVHEAIVEAFTQRAAGRIAQLRVGDGMNPAVQIGPLINRGAFEKVAAHVADALKQGARRIVGEDRAAPADDFGAFFPPTLLTGISTGMRLWNEETFGPVVAIHTFASDEEAITLANGTPYGLAAYLFTQDADRAQRIIARLRFGHVGQNTGTGPTPEAPFGGMKQSGLGREGGIEGLLEYCELQTVVAGAL